MLKKNPPTNFDYFYFIRHGRTDANVLKLMAGGNNDIPINSEGILQAQNAANILISRCSEITSIVSSPMTRALQTTEIINKTLNLSIQKSDSLREWIFGTWEGQTWDQVSHEFLDHNKSPIGGESRSEFYNRVLNGLEEVLSLPQPILIVAHGGVWYAIQQIFSLPLYKSDNCQIFKIKNWGQTFNFEVIE